MRLSRLSWLAPLLLLTAYCGSDGDAANVCAPGIQIGCACPGGGKGVQICYADGTGYGLCQCSDAGSAGNASAGASGGGRGGGSSGGASGAPSGGSSGSASGGSSGSAAGAGAGGVDASAGSSGTSSGGASTDASAGSGGGAGTSAGGAPSDASVNCPLASVTNAQAGSCDLVQQNCTGNFTCSIQQSGADWRTDCMTFGAGTKALGESCTSHNECLPKLRCTQGKCTRPCCPEYEAQICGTGQCDLRVFPSSGTGYINVCTFSPPCRPWVNDCPAGQPETTCYLWNNRFLCKQPRTDAAPSAGTPCQYLQDCASSQICIYATADAGSGTCRWLCKVNNSAGAADSGIVGGPPGQGGCMTNQTCVPFTNPSWLGFCNP